MGDDVVAQARRLADEVLFPAAADVDALRVGPAGGLDVLAAQGFYGLAAPPGVGSLQVPGLAAACRVIEEVAGGCLTTAFVWAQHHGALAAAAGSARPGVAAAWAAELASGRCRAGVAIGASLRPGPAALRAVPVDGGYVFDGRAPWVTGWGLVDVLHVAARDPDDAVVWALLDARAGTGWSVDPLDLVAVAGSSTVELLLHRVAVPADRVTGVVPFETWSRPDPLSLRFNGSLALGVAGRCIRLGPDGSPLAAELDACRHALDTAGPEEMPAARAAASELALRAAAALTAASGSRAVLAGDPAERLFREAMFLLVFGARPSIRDALLARLHAV